MIWIAASHEPHNPIKLSHALIMKSKAMRNLIKLFLACVLIANIFGCSSGLDIEMAKSEVDDFHKLMNLGLYSKIYEGMADVLKKKNTETQIVEFLSGVERKLGKYKEAKLNNLEIKKSFFGDSYIILVYDATYENDHGLETFFVMNENGKMRISAYDIRSNSFLK